MEDLTNTLPNKKVTNCRFTSPGSCIPVIFVWALITTPGRRQDREIRATVPLRIFARLPTLGCT
jgi:hypothetical protein